MSLGMHYNQGADLLTYVTNPEVFALTDGMLSLPGGPGLGVTIDEAAVRAAAENPHRWRNVVWRQADGGYAEW
jgi:galactonate dehydratase